MAYTFDGDTIKSKAMPSVSCSSVAIIIVTGITPCGHMLLNTGGKEGWYFHVTDFGIKYPKFMGYTGYLRYMRENEKREFARVPVSLANPAMGESELSNLLMRQWFYDPMERNCTISFRRF